MTHADRREDISADLEDGLCAYATEHAELEDQLADRWDSKWQAIRERAQVLIDSGFQVNEGDVFVRRDIDIDLRDLATEDEEVEDE